MGLGEVMRNELRILDGNVAAFVRVTTMAGDHFGVGKARTDVGRVRKNWMSFGE